MLGFYPRIRRAARPGSKTGGSRHPYSLAALLLSEAFFWELVTLIDIMLLGHWIDMRSVRQASSALNELAKLMPDSILRSMTDTGGSRRRKDAQ